MLFFLRKWNLIRCNMVNTPQVCVLQPEQTVSRLLIRKSRPAAKSDSGPPVPKHWKTSYKSSTHMVSSAHCLWTEMIVFMGVKLVRNHVFVCYRAPACWPLENFKLLLALLLFKDTLHSSSVTDMVCIHASQHLLRKLMFTTDLPLKCWIELW